ncbi:hypothetical protein [Actinokineospora bangkokensis]|uniref:hypothetical protein n=1 Tax=Actinokineospora bangkokensis TaxID=1193682 RepID=UPI001E5E4EB4|nr:hypothetical protein [Actinokineospora bangkokensis]
MRPDVQQRLRHVKWIGGGSGAGKSTIARHLAARHGLRIYATDDAMLDHARRSTPESAPQLTRFLEMSMDERWLGQTPEAMVDSFHWFRGECFDLVVEDLLTTAAKPGGVIAEGFRLLPHLVRPLLIDPGQAVWLLPTPEFRSAAFDNRGTMWDIPNATSDPRTAQCNLLKRDHLFTERLRREVEGLGLPFVDVHGSLGEDELVNHVAATLGL